MRETARRLSTGGLASRDGDLSSLPPLIREKIMKDKNRPAELFRKDLITAMKIPDTEHVDPETYWSITDSWKPDYDKGVQIPVNPEAAPPIRVKARKDSTARDAILGPYVRPKKLINVSKREEMFDSSVHDFCDLDLLQKKLDSRPRYNLDALDFAWLTLINRERVACGLNELSEEVLELVVDDLETRCHNAMQANQMGIEYDEDTQCDVCGLTDYEEGNDMVFCDQCDLCVHQACYGIVSVPAGSWLCVPCSRGYSIKPQCALCPEQGGALKPDADVDMWAHVACALWVPEVTFGNAELMQPLQNLHKIPAWRRKLTCVICEREGYGACIQCNGADCQTAYHVTCAQKGKLSLRMVLKADKASLNDVLELKTYCKEHDQMSKNGSSTGVPTFSYTTKKLKDHTDCNAESDVKDVESQKFYDYVSPNETSAHLRSVIDPLGVDQIFNFWKLKRMEQQGKPLLQLKHEESLQRPVQIDDELSAKIRHLVHLRQDLERARNLTYLLQRREKQRKLWVRAREDVTMLQLKASEEHPDSLRVIRTANQLDDIYDRLHCHVKIYGYPADSVASSLMIAVAREKRAVTPPGISTPSSTSIRMTPRSAKSCRGRKSRIMIADENQPLGRIERRRRIREKIPEQRGTPSTRMFSSSSQQSPTDEVRSPTSSPTHSAAHKFLRVGRKRGGPFKRAMMPDLHNDDPGTSSASLAVESTELRLEDSHGSIIQSQKTQGSHQLAGPSRSQKSDEAIRKKSVKEISSSNRVGADGMSEDEHESASSSQDVLKSSKRAVKRRAPRGLPSEAPLVARYSPTKAKEKNSKRRSLKSIAQPELDSEESVEILTRTQAARRTPRKNFLKENSPEIPSSLRRRRPEQIDSQEDSQGSRSEDLVFRKHSELGSPGGESSRASRSGKLDSDKGVRKSFRNQLKFSYREESSQDSTVDSREERKPQSSAEDLYPDFTSRECLVRLVKLSEVQLKKFRR